MLPNPCTNAQSTDSTASKLVKNIAVLQIEYVEGAFVFMILEPAIIGGWIHNVTTAVGFAVCFQDNYSIPLFEYWHVTNKTVN